MTDLVTTVGFVATPPKHLVTSEGLAITSFRFASTARRFDRTKQQWVDGDTNWFTVTCFRQLAINAAGSVSKGDRLLVSGRLRIREWEAGEKSGTNVEIDAEALGHDLTWGTTTFARSVVSGHSRPADEQAGTPAPGAAEEFPESLESGEPLGALATPF